MKMFESRILTSPPMLMLLLSLVIASFFNATAGQIGVCYGMRGEPLPSHSDVVALYKKQNITRMRIYGPNPDALAALRNSGIELILDVPTSELGDLASSQTKADKWVQENVQRYINGVKFRYINVGNEVKPSDGRFLLQAIQNIEKAISGAGLGIKVSTAIATDTTTDTFPPSKGRFRDDYKSFLEPVIGFLVSKQSPFLVNLYPYFSYSADMTNIHLDYALFTAQSTVNDDQLNLKYQNLFDATLDSVYAALEKSGGGSLEIVVSETGWPTQEGVGANVENAKTYVNNLIQHVKSGTPRKPGKAIETYIFAMFDENQKDVPPPFEKFWGLFHPDQQPKYEVNFN